MTFLEARNLIAARIRANRARLTLRLWCAGQFPVTGPRGQWRFQKDLPGRNSYAVEAAIKSFGAREQQARTVMSKLHLT